MRSVGGELITLKGKNKSRHIVLAHLTGIQNTFPYHWILYYVYSHIVK